MSDIHAPNVPRVPVRRQRAWNRFLLVALALHIPLFIYPVLRLGDWLDLPWLITIIILIPIASSQLVSRLYLRGKHRGPAHWWRIASDFWLGLSPVLLLTLLVFEVVVGVGLVDEARGALSTLLITASLGVVGVVMATTPVVKRIHLPSAKLGSPLRFVQITDVHIGSRSSSFLADIVFRINLLEPDFVCITGDFIDQTGVPESSLVSLRSLTCPIYFSIGNHERYEDLDAIIDRLQTLGVRVLRTEMELFRDDVQVTGIDDSEDAGQVARELDTLEIDGERYQILLYHRPKGLEDAAERGIDLMLSGHTHNGQIFPFNLIVGRVFDRIVGLYEHRGSYLYVSQGTGTWGPVMRLGTRAEITEFVIASK